MVCFNSGATIRRALESIAFQIVQPDEVIIIDGGSKDNTLEILNDFSCLPLKVLSEPDNRIYNAMNKGLILSQSDVIGFLNSDDEFSDLGSLARVKESFVNDSQAQIFVSGVDYVKSSGVVSRKWRIEKIQSFESGWHSPHPGFYALRELLLTLNGFNEDYRIASDFDLMFRSFLTVKNENIIVDAGKIVNMYLGGESNASLKNILRGNKEIRHSFRSNGIKVSLVYTIKRLINKILSKCKLA